MSRCQSAPDATSLHHCLWPSTPSANEQAKDLILVQTVQIKPMIKAQISGRMISSSTSDVANASVHSEKTRLKKLIMIIIIMK